MLLSLCVGIYKALKRRPHSIAINYISDYIYCTFFLSRYHLVYSLSSETKRTAEEEAGRDDPQTVTSLADNKVCSRIDKNRKGIIWVIKNTHRDAWGCRIASGQQ